MQLVGLGQTAFGVWLIIVSQNVATIIGAVVSNACTHVIVLCGQPLALKLFSSVGQAKGLASILYPAVYAIPDLLSRCWMHTVDMLQLLRLLL